ncbi:MAG: YopT-type cysteine protease domain-containing protein [Pseudomonadota bacterium]
MPLTEYAAHKLVQFRAKAVRESVIGLGHVSQAFSQSIDLYGFLSSNDAVYGGVCDAMVCFWIAAGGGGGFWQRLRTDGSQLRQDIAALQAGSGVGNAQIRAGNAWLQSKQLALALPCNDDRDLALQEMLDTITAPNPDGAGGTAQPVFRKLSFSGRAGAHTVGLLIAGNVVFFDPNFGEFEFDSIEKFREWFKLYWVKSLYNLGLSGTYCMYSFVHA